MRMWDLDVWERGPIYEPKKQPIQSLEHYDLDRVLLGDRLKEETPHMVRADLSIGMRYRDLSSLTAFISISWQAL